MYNASGKKMRPNIVLIMADDMGFSDIGCYGSEINTPHLDRLAQEGVSFTQMYNAARCCPTRASLLTGLYPHQAGMGGMVNDLGVAAYQGYLSNHCVTIAEALKEGGYQTGLSGKWHVGGTYKLDPKTWTPGDKKHPIPTQRGFDRFYGTLTGAGSFYRPHTLMEQNRIIDSDFDSDEHYYYTDAISENAVRMIEGFSQGESPFFLYTAYTAPHYPLHALPEDIAKYRGTYLKGWDSIRQERYERLVENGIINEKWPLSPRDDTAPPWEETEHKDWEDIRMAVYAAQVDRMDQGIGKIMNKLKELGQEENTLVMFLSDNGGSAEVLRERDWFDSHPYPPRNGKEGRAGTTPAIIPGPEETYMSYGLPWANASNTPFRLYKKFIHEGGISTPFIMHWPAGAMGKNRIVNSPAHIIDIMATCLDVSGVNYPNTYNNHQITPLEGESLYPAVLDDNWKRHSPLFWEHQGNRAVRWGDWKMVSTEIGSWELYNIKEDRTELRDLFDQKAEEVEVMENLYNEWADRCGVLSWNDIK